MITRRRLGRILTACAALTGLVLTSAAPAGAQPVTHNPAPARERARNLGLLDARR